MAPRNPFRFDTASPWLYPLLSLVALVLLWLVVRRNYFTLFGFVVVMVVLLIVIWPRCFRAPTDLWRYHSDTHWAVITGATDGIGRAIALELVRRGWKNFMLLGRNQERADSLVAEIKELCPTAKTKIMLNDLSNMDEKQMDQLTSYIMLRSIGLLVNNVSLMLGPEYLRENTSEEIRRVLAVNVTWTTLLTRAFVASYISKKERRALLMISSFAGTVPVPLIAVYSATKAYQLYLGRALAVECAGGPIDVTVVTPGTTVPTAMTRNLGYAKEAWWRGISSPEAVARGSLDALGQEVQWIPTWPHLMTALVTQAMPRRLRERLMLSYNASLRRSE